MSEIRREILTKIDDSWEALQGTIDLVPPDRLEEAGVVEAWSVKDLIGHVTSWEPRCMSAIHAYEETGDETVLEWGDVDEFNAVTTESNRSRPLEDLRSDMQTAHDEFLAFVEGLPCEVAQEPRVQRRVRIDGYEHYAEHTEHILKWLPRTSPR